MGRPSSYGTARGPYIGPSSYCIARALASLATAACLALLAMAASHEHAAAQSYWVYAAAESEDEVALLRYDAADPTAAGQATLCLVNAGEWEGAEIAPGGLLAPTGLNGFSEITPGRPQAPLDVHGTESLQPSEIRVFAADTEDRS